MFNRERRLQGDTVGRERNCSREAEWNAQEARDSEFEQHSLIQLFISGRANRKTGDQ